MADLFIHQSVIDGAWERARVAHETAEAAWEAYDVALDRARLAEDAAFLALTEARALEQWSPTDEANWHHYARANGLSLD
jgi:hypothetical protein